MSRRSYQVTALARVDLLQLWLYLAREESLDISDEVLADIEEAIEQIVESPGIGHRREDLTKRDLRFFAVYSYLIVYRRKADLLTVVRVVHGAQNVRRGLKR